MVRKLLLTICLSFIIVILSSTSIAFALARPVGGIDMTKSNWDTKFPGNYYWTGTFAANYIMSAPTLTNGGGHINSIYMKQEDQNFHITNQFELGWM